MAISDSFMDESYSPHPTLPITVKKNTEAETTDAKFEGEQTTNDSASFAKYLKTHVLIHFSHH